MNYPVIKAASYCLVHTPNLMYHNGSTQVVERIRDESSEYLKKLKQHIRNFEEAVKYPPNQVYIGNMKPEDLSKINQPWYDNPVEDAQTSGEFGDIIPEDVFYGFMKIVDAFDLVLLDESFVKEIKLKIQQMAYTTEEDIARIGKGVSIGKIEELTHNKDAEGLYLGERMVGCVKKAHDIDETLSAHVMVENLATKASAVLTLRMLLQKNNISPEEIDYVIETSEEACGDMNQRGGGNFAKAIAAMAGCNNATGCDIRAFCAGPAHGIVNAASLVQAGVFKNVVVLGGGAAAKLGMNGKDHVKKGMPVLEDVLGGFAVLISENDGRNPVIRTDLVGKHTVGAGSSPQAVITSLVAEPLDKEGRKIPDVDKYAVEMQNPEITRPAGAGDVPQSNYKMIGALAVKRNELERSELMNFVQTHGMPGFAPTQGHIPSGVPFIGFARKFILKGEINTAMIIGKGSLFLGRMTDLFDGVSFIIEKNAGKTPKEQGLDKEEIKTLIARAMKEVAEKLLNSTQ